MATPRFVDRVKSWFGGGPINPTNEGGIPVGWAANFWQQNKRPLQIGGESATVNACVNAYAQGIAMLPGGHWRKDGKGGAEEVTGSALSRILRAPNAYQTRSDFMLNLVTDLMFTGNAYAWAQRNARNEVDALHLMPGRSTAPMVDRESGDIFYALADSPMVERIDYAVPARDVLHIRGRCRYHPLLGETPIAWAAMATAANVSITASQATFFGNASQPSGVLTTAENVTSQQMERLREAWQGKAAGMAQGGVPILGGGLKWVPMAITSQDAQLVEAFKMTVGDIARAFGIPLPLVGELANANFNNVEQLISLWLATGLGFWVEHIEIAFDKFFKLPANEFTELDVDTLLRTDFAARIEGLTKAISGGLYSPNEARAKEGLGKVDHGDEPRVQAQVVPLSAATQTPAAPSAPAAPVEPVTPANDDDAPPPAATAEEVKGVADLIRQVATRIDSLETVIKTAPEQKESAASIADKLRHAGGLGHGG